MTAISTPQPVLDRRDFKRLFQQMSRALRDSEGGGIMERFEAVSKLLFTKIVDEREVAGTWDGNAAKKAPELVWRNGESERVVYERARTVWNRAVAAYPRIFSGARSRFPGDTAGVARIVRLLDSVSLSDTPDDVKGAAYEELLRNTFEKNDNQQYFTPRHVVEFMVDLCEPTARDAVCDPAAGSGGFLVGALSRVRGAKARARFVAAMRGAELDERMAWVARINMLLHGGDPTSIFHVTGAGALAPPMRLRQALPMGSFSLILTNPPFGSDMTDSDALTALETGRGRASRRRGILFVERCLELLDPGGRLAIVLDDSVLNLPTNGDVRELIRREAVVEAVVSLPDVTFMPYSTAKSSILVLRKKSSSNEEQAPVFMADVEHVGNRPNGDPLYSDERDEQGHRKLKSDLPAVLELYAAFRRGEEPEREFEGTTVFAADIDEHLSDQNGSRLDVFFFHPARRHADERLAHSGYPVFRLGDLVEMDGTAVNPAAELGDATVRWIGLGDVEAQTGRYEPKELVADRIRSNAHVFRSGDVLFSRLRPKLRKVVRVPDDDEGGYCSSELLVFRAKANAPQRVLVDLLAYLLRSDLVYGQLIYQVTGIGRPRVGAETVRNVRLPIPPMRKQRELLRELVRADREADKLRAEAQMKIDEAAREAADAFERVVGELCPDGQPAAISSSVGSAVSTPSAARRTASA